MSKWKKKLRFNDCCEYQPICPNCGRAMFLRDCLGNYTCPCNPVSESKAAQQNKFVGNNVLMAGRYNFSNEKKTLAAAINKAIPGTRSKIPNYIPTKVKGNQHEL